MILAVELRLPGGFNDGRTWSMRVLHVYATYYPDRTSGVAECIRQLGLGLRGLDVETRIFALSPRPHPETIAHPEGKVFRSKAWAAPASCDIGGFAALRQYRRLCAWADVVHHHAPWPFGDFLHFLSGCRKPLVVTWHSDVVRQKLLGLACAPLRDALLRRARAVVATSPAYARTSPVLSRENVAAKLCVIPPGMQDRCGRAASVPAMAGNPAVGAPFILFLGALRYYKGLPFLIEAARDSSVPVVICGAGDDRELRRVAGSSPHITFAGHVCEEQKWALLRACSALVLPSHLRSEAYGMVLVEAAMCGKPMISCEIGTGTSFINKHGETGFVVEPGSPAALASAMKRLLEDQALREKFGRAARERYEDSFDGRRAAEAHLRLYREILTARDARPHRK